MERFAKKGSHVEAFSSSPKVEKRKEKKKRKKERNERKQETKEKKKRKEKERERERTKKKLLTFFCHRKSTCLLITPLK